LILLANQNRSLWNPEQIAEGVAWVEKALSSRRFGPYTLQAAIAAVHAEPESPLRPTGGRLLRFTTSWCGFSLRRWFISIALGDCRGEALQSAETALTLYWKWKVARLSTL
jgi:hypothetical protein